MRITIIGANETASALRGRLTATERYALSDKGLLTITIREEGVKDVIVDGVDSLFESIAVTRIAELTSSGRVVLQRGGGNRNDRALVVTVPHLNFECSNAVELGLFRALEELQHQALEPKPFWRRWFVAWLLVLVFAPPVSAQFFTTAVRTIQASGTPLPSRPIVNMLGAGVSCVDNPASGRTDCTFSGGGGGGAPTDAQYWVGAANATLSAEHNLGALATGLVINTAGTPSAYAGASCTNQFPRSLNASGAATCASVALAADVSGNLPVENLGGGAGASSTTFWRGDGSWQTPIDTTGAPTGATYLTTTADATLTNEVIIGLTDDTAIVANGTTWQAKALPSCSNGTTSKLLYDTATNTFSCGTDQGGGGGSANVVEVSIDFGTALSSLQTVTVTGQTWVTSTSVILCSPFATDADGQTVENYFVTNFSPVASNRVVGTGFDLTVLNPTSAAGIFRFHCTGA